MARWSRCTRGGGGVRHEDVRQCHLIIISYTETSQNQLDLKWIDFMYRATTYNKAQIFEFMSDVGIINNHEDQLKLAISYEKITETSDDQYELATPDW